MFSIRELTITYPQKEQPACQNVCLEVGTGEIVLLAGGNGSGKSTLLHGLAGLIPGIFRADVTGSCHVNGRVEMALQDSDIFLLATPEEELDFILQNQGLTSEIRLQKLERLISLFHLEALLKRTINSLSGGERQRLALAAAIASEPEVLLLDEPLAQLDSSFKTVFLQLLQELAASGTSILISTTFSSQYEPLNAKYCWLHEGQIVWQGCRGGFHERWEQARSAGIDVDGKGLFLQKRSDEIYHQKKDLNGNNPVLALENLSFSYGDTFTLQDVSLSMGPGELAALTGPNGSGKSTLLKLITGILKPCRGTVQVKGKDIAGQSIAGATTDSGFLFQNPDHQIFQDKVIKEVAWGLKMRKLDPKLIPTRVEKWLKRLQMEHLAEEHPYSLTKTDRQWVALAGVLAREPSLLLLDEPTHGMDCVNTARFMEVIMELVTAGISVLMVTHHGELADHYAHQIFHMDKGMCCIR
jgi:energy-coupling factor transport system ATP-binding protein